MDKLTGIEEFKVRVEGAVWRAIKEYGNYLNDMTDNDFTPEEVAGILIKLGLESVMVGLTHEIPGLERAIVDSVPSKEPAKTVPGEYVEDYPTAEEYLKHKEAEARELFGGGGE